MPDTQSYDRRTIMFHWLTAGLVGIMWLIPQFIDDFSNPIRVYPRSLHILLGVFLLAVLVARILWRITHGRHLPPAETGLLGLVAQAAHYGLYLVLGGTLLLGLGYELVRGDNILNIGRLPSIAPGNRALLHQIGSLHGTAANLILIMVGLHATAALFHHYVRKDDVLRRMLPRT